MDTKASTYTTDSKTAPLWQLQTLRLIQLLGFLSLSAGSADLTGILKILPVAVNPWLLAIGPLLLASKPALQIIGDMLDNGKTDGSFKLPLWIVSFLLMVGSLVAIPSLVGCAQMKDATTGLTISPTMDGCLMMSKVTESGNTYMIGPCLDTKGEIDHYRTIWVNPEKVTLMANFYPKTQRTEIKYMTKEGVWVKWDSKSGVSLGNAPSLVDI